jgi:hypothetical protein
LSTELCPTLQAQVASQRQLNGFLIGQRQEAIARSFTEVLQVDTTPDGWIYRSYLLDRAHHAYMSFKFPATDPDYAVSIQIAGDTNTPMAPFVGLVLGTLKGDLLSRFGAPSQIEHQPDIDTDLYAYDGHNYSFEIDSRGRLSSIQIFAGEGFADVAPTAMPSWDSLTVALEGGPNATLEYLCPDVEVYREGHVVSFRRGALMDLRDDASDLTRTLFQGPTSVLAVLRDPANRSRTDANIRLWERGGSGAVWKFPTGVPVAELVFKVEAGQWRLWEIRYR